MIVGVGITAVIGLVALFPLLGPLHHPGHKKPNPNIARIHALKFAIVQYQTTYDGILPFTSASHPVDRELDDRQYQQLLDTLTNAQYPGSINDNGESNPKSVTFLKIATFDRRGIPALTDTWGNRLHVALDLDYNDRIAANHIPGMSDVVANVAIWSNGPDGSSDVGEHDMNRDNILSWRQ